MHGPTIPVRLAGARYRRRAASFALSALSVIASGCHAGAVARPGGPPAGAPNGPWSDVGTGDLDSLLSRAAKQYGVPAMQATVRWADGTMWRGSSGITARADRGSRDDAVFRVGSLTKLFTSVLVLQLVDAGAISLDDPLSRWFPGVPEADRISVRMLLAHRSGVPEVLRSPWVQVRTSVGDKAWRPDDLITIAARRRRTGEPDARFAYSNTNYILLGRIAERVTGQPVAVLLRERITAPLGLARTRILPDTAPPAGLLTGYDRDMIPWPGYYRLRPGARSWATVAFTAGAMVSTADELARFVEALAAGRLVSPDVRKEMLTFHAAPMSATPAQRGYGLGVEQLDLGAVESWGHVGSFIGFTAAAVHVPSRGITIAVTGNLSTFDVLKVVSALEQASAARMPSATTSP